MKKIGIIMIFLNRKFIDNPAVNAHIDEILCSTRYEMNIKKWNCSKFVVQCFSITSCNIKR